MEIRAFTEAISDTAIRYQITIMRESVMVWIQQSNEDGGSGSLPRLAAAMPGARGTDGLPAATCVLGGRSDTAGERLAARLAHRCRLAVFACVDVAEVAGVGADVVFRRVVRELVSAGVVRE